MISYEKLINTDFQPGFFATQNVKRYETLSRSAGDKRARWMDLRHVLIRRSPPVAEL